MTVTQLLIHYLMDYLVNIEYIYTHKYWYGAPCAVVYIAYIIIYRIITATLVYVLLH